MWYSVMRRRRHTKAASPAPVESRSRRGFKSHTPTFTPSWSLTSEGPAPGDGFPPPPLPVASNALSSSPAPKKSACVGSNQSASHVVASLTFEPRITEPPAGRVRGSGSGNSAAQKYFVGRPASSASSPQGNSRWPPGTPTFSSRNSAVLPTARLVPVPSRSSPPPPALVVPATFEDWLLLRRGIGAASVHRPLSSRSASSMACDEGGKGESEAAVCSLSDSTTMRSPSGVDIKAMNAAVAACAAPAAEPSAVVGRIDVVTSIVTV